VSVTVPDVRERLHQAVLRCAADQAFRFSVEDVARAAGVSRATVYRYFPGGKEELVAESVAWEVGRFFTRIHEVVVTEQGLTRQLEVALAEGHRLLEEHVVLSRILREDPERFLADLGEAMGPVREGIVAYLSTLLRQQPLADGVEVAEAADYLARLFLSYVGHAGVWDLEEPDRVARLVRTQFVAGILRP
jgi:AcrR family transcriptional regulator